MKSRYTAFLLVGFCATVTQGVMSTAVACVLAMLCEDSLQAVNTIPATVTMQQAATE